MYVGIDMVVMCVDILHKASFNWCIKYTIIVNDIYITVVCQVGDQTYFPAESFKEDCNTW